MNEFEEKTEVVLKVDDKVLETIPSVIDCNFEEVKAALVLATEKDRATAVTAETLDYAKGRCALINKTIEQIEDKRKQIKKEWNAPYAVFEKKCKELTNILTEAREAIWGQVKQIEDGKKAEKDEMLADYFADVSSETVKHYFTYDAIRNEKWLNKGTSKEEAFAEIEKICKEIETAIKVICEMHFNLEAAVLRKYAENRNLPEALSYGNMLETDRKEKAETVKKEEKNEAPAENEEERAVDFRVYATRSQLLLLKAFLKENNIKYGKIPEKNTED